MGVVRGLISILFLFGCAEFTNAQCYTLDVAESYEIAFPFPHQCMTVIHDVQDRPYLYTASMTDGVRIFSTNSSKMEYDGIPVSELNELGVMSVSQSGDYVYVALGDHFANDENSGLAIIDVSDPENAFVTDVWTNGPSTGGAGIVKVVDNTAYLGAMQHGLIILDVEDKYDISEISRVVPDINFPDANPDPAKYNARGLDISGSEVYMCYDAGGVRIISIEDINNPEEIGRYSLPTLNGLPRAYNNCVYNGDKLYVAIDYCGMEVLDVSDPTEPVQLSWWNEWECETSSNNWFNSPGHTNEMAYMADCQIIGMSAGKSEAVFVDVKDPENPFLCTSFGSTSNNKGTWGLTAHKDKFYLGYIYVPLGIPFFSNYGGVKAVEVGHPCALGIEQLSNLQSEPSMNIVYHNDLNRILVSSDHRLKGPAVVRINDVSGKTIQQYETEVMGSKLVSLPVANVPTNIYMISFSMQGFEYNSIVYIQK